MPHIVIFLHEFFSALQHLTQHCCHIILCSLKKKIGEPAGTNISTIITHWLGLVRFLKVRLVYLFMPHIVIFLHEFFSALQHLTQHCCHIIGTEHSVSASNHCNSRVHGYGKKAYILKYQLDFKNNLINIGCATLYHLSMTYITVYYLSINSDYRNLAAELNYRFTNSKY